MPTPSWGASATRSRRRVVDEAFYRAIRDEEVARLGRGAGHVPEAAQLLDDLVLAADFPEFLTLDAYRRLQ